MQKVRFALFCATVCCVAAACTSAGGDPGPTAPLTTATLPTYSISPPPSTSTSTSQSPTSTSPSVPTTGPNVKPGENPPTLSSIGKTNTRKGADEFSRYWIATLDWGYATMDTTLAQQVFAPTCSGCESFINHEFVDNTSKQRHFIGGRAKVVDSTVMATDHHDGATIIVDVTIHQGSASIVSDSSKVVGKLPATTTQYRTWLKWTSEWHVVDWSREVKS